MHPAPTITVDFLNLIAGILLRSDREIVGPLLKRGCFAANAAQATRKGTAGGEADYVTQIDTRNETFLLKAFRRILPSSFAVGEESFDRDRDGNIALLSAADYAWIVDPLDGTNNVVRYLDGQSGALPLYGIMAALLHQGEPVAGWVLTSDAMGRKKLAFGANGAGSFRRDVATGAVTKLVLNTAQDGQETAPVIVTTPGAWPKKFQPVIEGNRQDGHFRLYPAPPKSAAHEMMLLFDGQADAAAFRQFRLWDHLPGMVIANNAGGKGMLLGGAAPAPAAQRRDGFLAVAREGDFAALRRALLGDAVYDRTEDPKPGTGQALQPRP